MSVTKLALKIPGFVSSIDRERFAPVFIKSDRQTK